MGNIRPRPLYSGMVGTYSIVATAALCGLQGGGGTDRDFHTSINEHNSANGNENPTRAFVRHLLDQRYLANEELILH